MRYLPPTRSARKLTNPVEQSHSSEADSFSASQEVPRILRNLPVRSRFHNSSPLDYVLSQKNPIHLLSRFFEIHFNTNFLSVLGVPSGLFSAGFFTKTLYAFLFFPLAFRMPRPSNSSPFDERCVMVKSTDHEAPY